MVDTQLYTNWFYEQTNTCPFTAEEQVALGITRMGELDSFVDRVMMDWTQQTDSFYRQFQQAFTPQVLTDYVTHRFCTYSEYICLFEKHPQQNPIWKEALFTFLGRIHEQKQNFFYERFTPERTSYFNLMEMVIPQMRTFFFPSLSCFNPTC